MTRKRWTAWLVGIALLAILVMFGGDYIFNPDAATRYEEAEAGLVTELSTVRRQDFVQDLNYLGTVESDNSAVVSTKMAADVVEIHREEGDLVQRGDSILELDSQRLLVSQNTNVQKLENLQSQRTYLEGEIDTFYSSNPLMSKIASVDASITFQSEELDKLQSLLEVGAVSQTQVDRAAHQIDTLFLQKRELQATAQSTYRELVQGEETVSGQIEEVEAALEELELSLEETTVRAPFEGQVHQIMVSAGDFAATGKPLVRVDRLSGIRVTAQVVESDLARIEEGMRAEITPSGSETVYDGTVAYRSPTVNPKTRVGEVRISVDLPREGIIVGTSASISLILEEMEDQILIPVEAVQTFTDKHVVYVEEEPGTVNEREVTLGARSDGWYHVRDGLEEGERIAVVNVQTLGDGSPIYTMTDGEERP
ncbi:MAG: efflux RND transporter periplasmic adaptor subunit [Bacillota bacterium]